jgi:antitoxin VapB
MKMALSIRDPRAAELARKLAFKQGTTMTTAIIKALENQLARDNQELSVSEKLSALSKRALAMAGPNRREMTKEEIDDLWTAE